MVETKVRPQEINIAVTSAELMPSFVGLPWWDNSVKVLKFDTSGNGIPTQFVTSLPQHTLTGEHGPKVTITQTAADNALVVTQQGNAVAINLMCGSTNSGRAFDITQAAAMDVVTISKSHPGVGVCLTVNNSGAGTGVLITQDGGATALAVVQNTLAVASRITQNTNQNGLYVNKVGVGSSAAISVDNAGTGAGLEIQQGGVGFGLRVDQNAATTALSIAKSVAGGVSIHLEDTFANADVQTRFSRTDGSGDPDMFLTYWGQSDVNTLGLTSSAGAGVHVTTNGRVVVSDFVASNFTSGTGKFIVVQTLPNPAVVITQSADSNALNITRSHTGSGGDAVNLTNSGSGTALDIMQANASGVALNLDHSSSSSVINVNKVSTSSANPAIKIVNSGSLASARDIEGHAANWWIDKSGNASFTNLVGLVGQVIRFFGAKNTAGVIVGVNPNFSIATGGITVPANTFPNGVLAIMMAECYQFNECELIVESRMTQPAGGTKQFAATPSILARDRAPVAVGGAANLGCAAMYLSGGTNSGEDWDVQSIMGFGLWVKSGTPNMSGIGGSDWDPAKATTIDYYKAYSDHGGGSATRVGRRTIFVFGF